MGKLRTAEFYNVDGGDGTDHFKVLEKSPWFPLYDYAAKLVPYDVSVCDLGCGAGRFAKRLQQRGIMAYTGIDFCEDRIRIAKDYVPGSSEYIGSSFEFWLADIMDVELPVVDCYVALEVLEHIEDDIGLIERLPRGKLLVFSVPPTDAASHVRVFPNWHSVFERYKDVLDFYTTAHFHKGVAMGKIVVRAQIKAGGEK